jgi:hypothetical protein
MPKYTVYAYIRRKGRHLKHKFKIVAVHTFQELPIDWSDLKSELLTTARNIYFEYEQLKTNISLEMHLGGRYKRAMTSYRTVHVHLKREPQFSARLTYLKNSNQVKVDAASFITPLFFYKYKDDYDYLERGKRWDQWELPKLPDITATLLDPEAAFKEPLTLKLPSYAGIPKGRYAATPKGNGYAGYSRGYGYAARRCNLGQKDKREES